MGQIIFLFPSIKAAPPRGYRPIDLVFVLDSSAVVQRWDKRGWVSIIRFTQDVISHLPIHRDIVRVGILIFSSKQVVKINLNQFYSREDLMYRIGTFVHLGEKTDTPAAIRKAYSEMFVSGRGDRRDAQNVMMIVTGSVPNTQSENRYHVRDMVERSRQEARNARSRGITIMAVGVGLTAHDDNEAYRMYGYPYLTGLVQYADERQLFIYSSYSQLVKSASTVNMQLFYHANQITTAPPPSE